MKQLSAHLKFLLSVQLTGILGFTIFRIILLVSQHAQLSGIPSGCSLLWHAFLKGLQFDSVIATYIIVLPCVVLLSVSTVQFYRRWLATAMAWFTVVMYAVAFTLCAADIPYFAEFYKHINPSVFNWAGEQSFVFGMIAKEPKYLIYLPCLLVLIVGFSLLVFRYKRRFYEDMEALKVRRSVGHILLQVLVVAACWGICFVGARGRLTIKSPIRVGTSYFCEYSFLNLLGQNPVFYFINTAVSNSKHTTSSHRLMEENKALMLAREYLDIDSVSYTSPVAHRVEPTTNPTRKNVVVILMESVSADLLTRNGAQQQLMPFLDSLSTRCYYFENCYSAGIHTMNGVYGTLFSYPAFFTKHPLKVNDVPLYAGMPYTLRSKGYQTVYITTHDEQFDNVGGFLFANYVQKIVAQKDYPSSKVLSNLGVPDDYMFEQSIATISAIAANGDPFFTCMLTASNHSPICLPGYYTPIAGTSKEQIVAYADWSLRKFFELAKQQPWYNNTVFVLLGDHGAVVGQQTYDVPLSYNHIPLMVVVPSDPEPKVFAQPCCQIDVFPTVMGLLNEPYVNNTMGIDAINHPRPYAYFCADNVVGCVDSKWLYIYRTDGRESLYDYHTHNPNDFLPEYPDVAQAMKDYAFAMLQTSEYVVEKGLVGPQ